jgi:hypothetical protein
MQRSITLRYKRLISSRTCWTYRLVAVVAAVAAVAVALAEVGSITTEVAAAAIYVWQFIFQKSIM